MTFDEWVKTTQVGLECLRECDVRTAFENGRVQGLGEAARICREWAYPMASPCNIELLNAAYAIEAHREKRK